jgi:thioredoxin-related protein
MDEDGAASVQPFLKKHPMDYAVALGPAELNGRYKLESLPVTLVFDRAGNQIQRFDGFTDEAALEAAVKQAL